jgi:tetratricopeptide (TPR) repeat protein
MSETFAQTMLARLHVPQESDMIATDIGVYCSRDLDFWGVESERAGELTNAAAAFQSALALNTNNLAAQINLDFNGVLRAGQPPVVDSSQVSDRIGRLVSIPAVVTEDGPFDDPSFCFAYGYILVQGGNYRQAAVLFTRVHELVPGYLPALRLLARIYALNRLPDRVLDVLRTPLKRPEDFSANSADLTDMHMLASAAYFQKNDLAAGSRLLETEISRNPTNDTLSLMIEEIYASRGMYSNALAVVDHRLNVSPDDPRWLYAQGSVYNLQKKYDEAIVTLNRMLAIQKDNNQVLYQLGLAYLGSSNLDEARADFEKVRE